MTTLTIPQVLRHAATNVEAGRNYTDGLQCQYQHDDSEWGNVTGPLFWDVLFSQNYAFRLAPRTISYTVKDQPEPLRVAPKSGTRVYYHGPDGNICDTIWNPAIEWHDRSLVRGNIFATKEDAHAADAARMAAFKEAT